jgi:hypothetical protein
MTTLSQHSAPGANAGFTFQFERALYWLARSPAGSVVGIETADDVAVTFTDSSKVLEQDKHSVRNDSKPFGNRSKDLWNTLAIWLDALDSKEVAADNTVFLMVTNKELPECLATQIGHASSDAEIGACVAEMEAAAGSPPKGVAPLMQRVLRPQSRANLLKLISSCELTDGSQAVAGPELRKKTIAELQLPEWCRPIADSITNELSGWVQKTVLTSWQNGEPGWVQRDHFVNELYAILDRRKRELERERSEHLIPVTDEKLGKERGRPFVKQLYLITDDDGMVDDGIRDFIRCNIEKNRLSNEGNITDDDWTAFESALLSRWTKIRTRVIRMNKEMADEDVGFEIFTNTAENHREKLAGIDTEQVYLTSGSYHRLADLIQIGWHPNFKKLMIKLTASS